MSRQDVCRAVARGNSSARFLRGPRFRTRGFDVGAERVMLHRRCLANARLAADLSVIQSGANVASAACMCSGSGASTEIVVPSMGSRMEAACKHSCLIPRSA